MALRPVTGWGHGDDEEAAAAALADCLFLAVDVDADDEAVAKVANRSVTRNIVKICARCALALVFRC